MRSKSLAPIVSTVILLVVVSLACAGSSTSSTPIPTPVPPTDTSRPEPTILPTSTSTPEPLPTPDVAATQKADEFAAVLTDFHDKGYITSTNGDIKELDPFKQEWAQIGWFNSWLYKDVVADFLFKAHFNWTTAAATSDPSGCGVIFGAQENGDYYVFFLDKSSIIFFMKRGANLYKVGKTKGPGRVSFGNPAEADVVVAVKGQSTYVSVDGEVTEYTLSADQTTKGSFGFSLLSGTNKDYGTRCEMTDLIFWTPK